MNDENIPYNSNGNVDLKQFVARQIEEFPLQQSREVQQIISQANKPTMGQRFKKFFSRPQQQTRQVQQVQRRPRRKFSGQKTFRGVTKAYGYNKKLSQHFLNYSNAFGKSVRPQRTPTRRQLQARMKFAQQQKELAFLRKQILNRSFQPSFARGVTPSSPRVQSQYTIWNRPSNATRPIWRRDWQNIYFFETDLMGNRIQKRVGDFFN